MRVSPAAVIKLLELYHIYSYYLGVSVDGVSHPATGLDLIGVEPPEFQFLFKEGTADMRRIVEFARPVVVEDLREDARMSIEEILVEDWIVIDESLGQSR